MNVTHHTKFQGCLLIRTQGVVPEIVHYKYTVIHNWLLCTQHVNHFPHLFLEYNQACTCVPCWSREATVALHTEPVQLVPTLVQSSTDRRA